MARLLVHEEITDFGMIMGLYSQASFSVSSRLHAGYFSYAAAAPNVFLCFGLCMKYEDAARSVGMDAYFQDVPADLDALATTDFLERWKLLVERVHANRMQLAAQLAQAASAAVALHFEHFGNFLLAMCAKKPCFCDRLQQASRVVLDVKPYLNSAFVTLSV